MKKLIVLLVLIVGGATFVPAEAEARDRDRHYRKYYRDNHCDRDYYSYRRPIVRHVRYVPRRVYYAPRPVYYTPPYYYEQPVYYSRPRSSFSFTFAR